MFEVDDSATFNEKTFLTEKGSNNKIILEKNAKFGTLGTPKVEFLGSNNTLHIKNGAVVKRGHYRFTGDNNTISIGSKSTINGAYMLCDSGCSIELADDCLVSNDVEFRTTDAHSIISLDTQEIINQPSSISIGQHVWIGKSVCIMPGVVLADNIIIGIRALVTKSFDCSFVSIGGVPAKILSSNVKWERPAPKRN